MEGRRILESWKAIAAYLGHSEKTCRKWEHELGLPVHRLDDSAKAHVFAYADELDRWKEKITAEKGRKTGGLFGFAGFSRHSKRTRIWIGGGSALFLIVLAGFLVWRITSRTAEPGGPGAVKSIAVLPFVDLSPNQEYDYLCDGMVETLIDSLNKVEGLRVPGRTSSFYFKGKDTPPKEIGKKLKVDYVLEASVQADGERLRVIPRLLSIADGYQLWSEKFDRGRQDIFAVEDDIARRVVENLKVKIGGDAGAPVVKPGTQNIAAYNLYLNGQYCLKRGYWEQKAIEYFEKALEEDPNYADAYAAIARSFYTLGRMGLLSPAEAFAKSKAAALRALEIDSRNLDALGTLGAVKMTYDWDFRGAENDFRKAIQDNPGSSPLLHRFYANLLTALGRYEEAIAEARLALRQDPLSPESIICEAMVYYFWRQYDLALAGCKRALEMDPQGMYLYVQLAIIYVAMGRYEDASAANQRRGELLGEGSKPYNVDAWWALVYALKDNPSRAREILANLKDYAKDKYYPYHILAWVYVALGEKDEAFFWLEKAYQERSGQLFYLNVYPLADPLRDDPRFKDLLRRIGLEK